MTIQKELVIIGAGVAGLTAGIYAKRSGLDVLVVEKGTVGGDINSSTEIDTYPALGGLNSQEFVWQLKEQASNHQVSIVEALVHTVNTATRNVTLEVASTQANKDCGYEQGIMQIEAKAIIIATGTRRKTIDCLDPFLGDKVSFRVKSSSPFFQGANVAVIGGDNSALGAALYMSGIAKTVYLIHKKPSWQADCLICKAAEATNNIVPIFDCWVKGCTKAGCDLSLTLQSYPLKKNFNLIVGGCFVYTGSMPNSELIYGYLRTKDGWILTDDCMRTSVVGILAAGDVRDKPLRQSVTAVSDGAIAAISAYKFLRGECF